MNSRIKAVHERRVVLITYSEAQRETAAAACARLNHILGRGLPMRLLKSSVATLAGYWGLRWGAKKLAGWLGRTFLGSRYFGRHSPWPRPTPSS